MNYKVSSQYLKSNEHLSAVFSESKDAHLFVAEKIVHDEEVKQPTLYRLYHEDDLIKEWRAGAGFVKELEDPERFNPITCPFSVASQSENNSKRSTLALFNKQEDAHLFISSKCRSNPESKTIYMIFKDNLLIATLNKNIIQNKALREQGLLGDNKGATLSPLSQRLTPPGGPADFWVEKNEEDE